MLESSTLGVRIAHEQRVELQRKLAVIDTKYGAIQVKVAKRPDGKVRSVPEYESIRRAAERAEVPIEDVYRAALTAGETLKKRQMFGEEGTLRDDDDADEAT